MKDPANLKTEGKIKKPTKAIAAKWTIEASLKMKISSDRFFNCILKSSKVDKDGVQGPRSLDEEELVAGN